MSAEGSILLKIENSFSSQFEMKKNEFTPRIKKKEKKRLKLKQMKRKIGC